MSPMLGQSIQTYLRKRTKLDTTITAPTEADWQNVMPRLAALMAKRETSDAIAIRLNREYETDIFTRAAVAKKRKQLNDMARIRVSSSRIDGPWAFAPLEPELRQLCESGLSYSAVAVELNRRHGTSFSKSAVLAKARRLSLPGRPSPLGQSIWTEAMSARVQELRVTLGQRCPDVAALMSTEFGMTITENMVKNRAQKLARKFVVQPPRSTLPPLTSLQAVPKSVSASLPTRISPKLLPTKPRIIPPIASNVVRLPVYGRVAPCCWPTNDRRPWLFCDKPSEPGKVYCRDHAKLAYIRVRDRREDAA